MNKPEKIESKWTWVFLMGFGLVLGCIAGWQNWQTNSDFWVALRTAALWFVGAPIGLWLWTKLEERSKWFPLMGVSVAVGGYFGWTGWQNGDEVADIVIIASVGLIGPFLAVGVLFLLMRGASIAFGWITSGISQVLGASDDRDRDRGWYGGDWDYATSSYRDVAMYSIGLIFFVGAFFLPVGEDEPIWAYLGLGGFAFLAAIQLYLAIMFRFRWNDQGVELTHRMTRPVLITWGDIRWARYIGTLDLLVFSGPGRPIAFIDRHRSGAIHFYDDLKKNIGDRLHSRWSEFDEILSELDDDPEPDDKS